MTEQEGLMKLAVGVAEKALLLFVLVMILPTSKKP